MVWLGRIACGAAVMVSCFGSIILWTNTSQSGLGFALAFSPTIIVGAFLLKKQSRFEHLVAMRERFGRPLVDALTVCTPIDLIAKHVDHVDEWWQELCALYGRERAMQWLECTEIALLATGQQKASASLSQEEIEFLLPHITLNSIGEEASELRQFLDEADRSLGRAKLEALLQTYSIDEIMPQLHLASHMSTAEFVELLDRKHQMEQDTAHQREVAALTRDAAREAAERRRIAEETADEQRRAAKADRRERQLACPRCGRARSSVDDYRTCDKCGAEGCRQCLKHLDVCAYRT